MHKFSDILSDTPPELTKEREEWAIEKAKREAKEIHKRIKKRKEEEAKLKQKNKG